MDVVEGQGVINLVVDTVLLLFFTLSTFSSYWVTDSLWVSLNSTETVIAVNQVLVDPKFQ